MSAKLEGTEILVPFSIWYFWSGFAPQSKLVQIIESNLSVTHPLDQMLSDGRREVSPNLDLGHLFTEDHFAKFVAIPLNFIRITCRSEPFRQLEKRLLFLLLQLDSILDKLHQHPVGAEPPPPCQTSNLLSHLCWRSYALTNRFIVCSHGTSMHHNGVVSRGLTARGSHSLRNPKG